MAPPLVAAGLVACAEHTSHHDLVDRARDLLVAGQAPVAERVLAGLERSPWVGRAARTGRWIAHALDGTPMDGTALPTADELPSLDPDAFPLGLITREAFERGQFDAVLRLSGLARSMGRPMVPALVTAARIETGRAGLDAPAAERAQGDFVRAVVTGDDAPRSRLVSRVREHLRHGEAGILLLDRRGRPLGRLVDGEIVPADGVELELLPRTLLDRAADHPTAGSLHLTLDLDLSRLALRAFGRYRGSIVLVDPVSGEILAAVSDRRTYARENGRAPFDQWREPASVAKLITTAASLRQGHDPDRILRHKRCMGHETYAGEPLYCPVIAGPLRGLDRAMAVSCNVAFADLGIDVGRRGLLDELNRWGFDQDLGPFTGGRILHRRGDARQLADLAIGLQDAEITPLHGALLAATVASGGSRPTPSLIAAVDGRLGLHPRSVPLPPGVPVLRPAWARTLEHAMRTVATRGTAMRMQAPGFPVAMKTGTASDPRYGFHVNYIGYGPVPDPRVAFSVRITDRPTSRHVRGAAAEVTGELLRGLRGYARRHDWLNGAGRPDADLALAQRTATGGRRISADDDLATRSR